MYRAPSFRRASAKGWEPTKPTSIFIPIPQNAALNTWAGCNVTLTFDKKSLRLTGFKLA